ncbi:MAG: ACT domain-containing protein [Spirochaetaceae bacterium]|nr:MAG: ACT domain-containing protein [Spirochaetaceae bacterium]
MELILLPDRLAICRLPKDTPIPRWALAGSFYAVTRTAEELSIVCPDGHPPAETETESGWRALQVQGPLPFEEIGIIASLTAPLAQAGIPTFVISTFNTDYLLVKDTYLSKAIRVLSSTHTVHT